MGALKRRWLHGRSQEELPQVRGQGQKPGGPHAQRAAAKRSYPTSEVRGGGLREDTQRPRSGSARGVNPHLRSGAVARRSYPTHLSPRPGAVAGRSNPTLRGHRRA